MSSSSPALFVEQLERGPAPVGARIATATQPREWALCRDDLDARVGCNGYDACDRTFAIGHLDFRAPLDGAKVSRELILQLRNLDTLHGHIRPRSGSHCQRR